MSGLVTKKLEDFINIHEGEKIIVCGTGMSLKEFVPNSSEFITIGVNDIGRLFHPTYLLITDHPNRFHGKRKEVVVNRKAKFMFTPIKLWRLKTPSKKVMFDLGVRGIKNLHKDNLLDHFFCSPYPATILAHKMGAKHIGLIGVDFTPGHVYAPKDGAHMLMRLGKLNKINDAFSTLSNVLKEKGTALYNLSKNSKLTKIPKITLDEFRVL